MNRVKFIFLLFIFVLFGSAYGFLGLSVDNTITESDARAISTLNVQDLCSAVHGDYAKELSCLIAIQRAVQSIGDKRCASKADLIEPMEFIKRNYGCCFDRARFIEKSARLYEFQTRHIYLIKEKFNFLANVLPLGQLTHATTEVLTSKGWIGVDSNEPFVLTDESGNPLTYADSLVNSYALAMMEPKEFYTSNIDLIYGLYSRHGSFHGLNIPGPEFVFSELLHNF